MSAVLAQTHESQPLSLEERVAHLERFLARSVLHATNEAMRAVGATEAAAGSLRALQRLAAPVASYELMSLTELTHRIAYDAARTDIECTCVSVGTLSQGIGWDLGTFTMEGALGFDRGEAEARIGRAARYLVLSGHLECLAGASNIVFIKDFQ